MRIALLADLHGNPIALDAVLADLQARGGVEGHWILGDLCAIGFDPAGVLDRLITLPNALFVRGNADRYVTTGELPPPTFDDVRADSDLIPQFAEVVGSFNWTKGYLTGRGWLDWLDRLPTEHRLTLPDGTHVFSPTARPPATPGMVSTLAERGRVPFGNCRMCRRFDLRRPFPSAPGSAAGRSARHQSRPGQQQFRARPARLLRYPHRRRTRLQRAVLSGRL